MLTTNASSRLPRGIVFRLDRVTDDLETVERLVAAGKIPASDDERRRMRALLEKFFWYLATDHRSTIVDPSDEHAR
jgi:hypothetical protein